MPDFTPEVNEKVLVIDKNGYDIWEGKVQSNENGKIAIHYQEYPEEDETVEGDGIQRILKWTRTNSRIFHQQEMHRNQQQQDSEEEEEQTESDESTESNEPEYKPVNAPVEKESKRNSKKKGPKAKKNKKPKKDTYHPRPEGARSNPRRGSSQE